MRCDSVEMSHSNWSGGGGGKFWETPPRLFPAWQNIISRYGKCSSNQAVCWAKNVVFCLWTWGLWYRATATMQRCLIQTSQRKPHFKELTQQQPFQNKSSVSTISTKFICTILRVIEEPLLTDRFPHSFYILLVLSLLRNCRLCWLDFSSLHILHACLRLTPPFSLFPQPDTSPTPAAAAVCILRYICTYRWHALLHHRQPIRRPVGDTALVSLDFEVFEFF